MQTFVKSNFFRQMNVGFVLDEGDSPNEEKTFFVLYGERNGWGKNFQIYFPQKNNGSRILLELNLKIKGPTGHSAVMVENTAAEKLGFMLNKFHEFRKTQMKILEKDPLNFKESTSVNCTIIHGGIQVNVVPSEFILSVDARLAPDMNNDGFEKMLREWCEKAGGDIELTFPEKDPYVEPTSIDESNIFWTAMKSALNDM